jgi:hypothetical protein
VFQIIQKGKVRKQYTGLEQQSGVIARHIADKLKSRRVEPCLLHTRRIKEDRARVRTRETALPSIVAAGKQTSEDAEKALLNKT